MARTATFITFVRLQKELHISWLSLKDRFQQNAQNSFLSTLECAKGGEFALVLKNPDTGGDSFRFHISTVARSPAFPSSVLECP